MREARIPVNDEDEVFVGDVFGEPKVRLLVIDRSQGRNYARWCAERNQARANVYLTRAQARRLAATLTKFAEAK